MDSAAVRKTEQELKALAAREALVWSRKPLEDLRRELIEPVGYERDGEEGRLQFEVLLLENEAEYVHAMVSVDDGTFGWTSTPVSMSFLVHSDGRIDL